MRKPIVGFIGRASTWDLLKGCVFHEHISLIYVRAPQDCNNLDLLIVERYLKDIVKCDCRTIVLDDVKIEDLIEALLKGLGVDKITVGIDVGNSRCGLVILANNTPIIHYTTTLGRIITLLKRLGKNIAMNINIGLTPATAELVSTLLSFLQGLDVQYQLIEENIIKERRGWFRDRYGYLSQDELDGLILAYSR